MKNLLPKSAYALATFIIAAIIAVSPVHANEADNAPEKVVSKLISAMENNSADDIRAAFADDATQLYERWYAMKKTGDKFKAWLESDIIKPHGRVENPVIKAEGENVVVTGTYKNNGSYTSPANFLLTVKDGKITSWTMRYD